MVKLQLSIKADLENVTDLMVPGDDFDWFFKVKCNSCNEEHPKLVTVNRTQERPLTAGKGTNAHFVWRCTNCRRESSAKFETASPFTPYVADSSGQFAPILVIECRGLEFIGFDPQGTWKCKGTDSGTVFDEVDFEEGEWTDYDEKASLPVSIMAIESKWTRAP
ncbi:hypothetical protein M408DRAFT_199463 [Serendipita vermifera MAFF 305830]|uniref:DUF866-domain-containing protein n=1 Tax=Serendipita vermifera MAFF 305830 TaxID=933852 RepID=A0A0C2WI71_SERVB|nr:hypothetical protein M408DRAFT_199463 [Serendipita vermifera MAFF 305830]